MNFGIYNEKVHNDIINYNVPIYNGGGRGGAAVFPPRAVRQLPRLAAREMRAR